MNFYTLPSNSVQLLSELVDAETPSKYLYNKYKNANSKEQDILRGIIKELRENGFIDVIWADNCPVRVNLNNSARTYNEQLAEYERQTQAFQNRGSEKKNANKERVAEFLQRGERIGKEEYHPAGNGNLISFISGPQYEKWKNDIYIFTERYLKSHPLYDDIMSSKGKISEYEKLMGYLQSLADDEELWGETEEINIGVAQMNNKVFIVHGHDNEAKLETARTLTNGGFEPIILHEQPDSGRTIIEKIERFADVCYAVVLYTECDLGRDKNDSVDDERFRARQNVVFEHGYLIGKLGRDRVTALVKGNVETPGDISGVVYTEMDKAGAWKMQLARNMQDVGLDIDMNTFLR